MLHVLIRSKSCGVARMRIIRNLVPMNQRLESARKLQVSQLPTNMRSFVFSCCIVLGVSEWPIPFVVSSDTMPSVELSLDAPPNPLPSVSHTLSRLEAEREADSASQSDKMVRAFNKELANARVRIADVFSAAEHRFLGQYQTFQQVSPQESPHSAKTATALLKSNIVKVIVAPGTHPPDSFHAAITEFEGTRVADEDAWSEAAVAEMGRLTDMVVATIESEINGVMKTLSVKSVLPRSANFLQLERSERDSGKGGTEAANVRVVAADAPYPTTQSLVENFQVRRDISEELGKAQALSMYMKLLEFENMLVEEGLNAFVSKL